ncbi:MAG: hypothetical protein JRI36_00020 [Deltaproteobacteria bacterium]|nr:hypothetical protein [Deltaproteobacteria bacterium]
MLDVSVSYNRYKFLGHEFLTWLWYIIETEQRGIRPGPGGVSTLSLGNRVMLENRKDGTAETITITGDEAGLEEGMLALNKGALVTELNLLFRSGDYQWRFTIKGESLHLVGFKGPRTGSVETQEDLEGAVLEKVYLCEQAIQYMDGIFKQFIVLRVSDDWAKKVVPRMKRWIRG